MSVGVDETIEEKELYNDLGVMKLVEQRAYKNYFYWIVSYGTHPCCYVAFDSYPAFLADGIKCHGGVSYESTAQEFVENTLSRFSHVFLIPRETDWIIGWDYAHCGDFYNISDRLFINRFINTKVWTISELIGHCEDVMEQLDFMLEPRKMYK